ncbi:hypothetical protein EW145_g1888 [Phellinidium pouzarii]|uniref:Peptidase A1 domain-containing protein n=1 Tax=Phellinidium pouzarii TaxID=167371 RepID=A0A4V3XDG1_9AGAM|nr:hypothetical protein EW145_g1888 [Phellinidium pouzarii]
MHTVSFAQVALSFLVTLSVVPAYSAASLQKRATTCNGHPEFCNRSFGNVSFVGAHDSYAVGTNNLATNQDYDVTQQLNDGTDLASVKSWMGNNTNDVVTLLIVNSDNVAPSSFDAVFQSAGLTSLSYSPPSASVSFTDWPTLGSMIDNGTRLVTFLDTGADFSSVPYIIDEFTNMWETAFDVTDPSFNCDVNRTKGDASTQLYTINHFLDSNTEILGTSSPTPDKDALNQTNAVSGTGSLGLQASQCGTEYGRSPNFMLVDFYEFGGGSVFEVAATLNGVTYSPSSPIATPILGASGSSSSSAALSAIIIPRGIWFDILDSEPPDLAHDPGPPVHNDNAGAPELMQPPISIVRGHSPVDSPHHAAPASANFFAQRPTFQVQLPPAQLQQFQDRSPYGSGDSDDGYTLGFATMEEFQAWRTQVEEDNMVEFIKGDTHGSKAVPPRFKDHVKLLEGEGCPASISYKTYYGITIVRAMYVDQHSHPTGLENLPFTRRGRKLAEQARKQQQKNGYCRTNPVLNGTVSTAVQAGITSEAVGAGDSIRGSTPQDTSMPPPMASLKPSFPENHADASPDMRQRANFVQSSSQTVQTNIAHSEHHAQTVTASPIGYYSTPADDYGSYRLAEPPIPYSSSAQPPIVTSTQSPNFSPGTESAAIFANEQSYLGSPVQIHPQYQQQHCLPTPTTPSPRYQASVIPSDASPSPAVAHCLPSPAYSRPRFSPVLEHSPQLYPESQATQAFKSPEPSPLSPRTPNRPSIFIPPQSYPQHYSSAQSAEYPDQDRWDRLEILFRDIRLYARSYTFSMESILALESALLRLCMEGQNSYGRQVQQAEQRVTQPQITAVTANGRCFEYGWICSS